MTTQLETAQRAWLKWYQDRLKRIRDGNLLNEDYTGYEQDLFNALHDELRTPPSDAELEEEVKEHLRDLGFIVIPPGEEKPDPASGTFPLWDAEDQKLTEASTLELVNEDAGPLTPREALVLAGLTDVHQCVVDRVQASWERGDERDTCAYVTFTGDDWKTGGDFLVWSCEPACYRVSWEELDPSRLRDDLKCSATRTIPLDVDMDEVKFYAEVQRQDRSRGRQKLRDQGTFWTGTTARPLKR